MHIQPILTVCMEAGLNLGKIWIRTILLYKRITKRERSLATNNHMPPTHTITSLEPTQLIIEHILSLLGVIVRYQGRHTGGVVDIA
jgi:hypothetical protein